MKDQSNCCQSIVISSIMPYYIGDYLLADITYKLLIVPNIALNILPLLL
jgi:hypothetical protein